jgi:hypothetical protein
VKGKKNAPAKKVRLFLKIFSPLKIQKKMSLTMTLKLQEAKKLLIPKQTDTKNPQLLAQEKVTMNYLSEI